MAESPRTPESLGVDPNASPWSVPPIAGISFDDESEEAQAIERIIRWSERDTADGTPTPDSSRDAAPS